MRTHTLRRFNFSLFFGTNAERAEQLCGQRRTHTKLAFQRELLVMLPPCSSGEFWDRLPRGPSLKLRVSEACTGRAGASKAPTLRHQPTTASFLMHHHPHLASRPNPSDSDEFGRRKNNKTVSDKPSEHWQRVIDSMSLTAR